jgi:hypothetical protein
VDVENELINETFGGLSKRVDDAGFIATELHSTNKDVVLNLLVEIDRAVKSLKAVEAELHKAVIDNSMLAFDGENVEGLGWMKVTRTGKRTIYDGPALRSQVTQKLVHKTALDAETGEIKDDVADAVVEVVQTVCALTGAHTKSFTGWRAGTAKDLGIDLKDYSAEEGGRLVVRIVEAPE